MRPQCVILAAALFVAAPICVRAQTMKPGLWDVNTKMQGAGQTGQETAQVQQQMANLTPEQRKMIEAMMAKSGMSVGMNGPGTVDVKVCLTKAMAQRYQIPMQSHGCQQTVSPRSGNTMKITFTCTNPPSSGEGQITLVSPEAYTITMTVTSAANGEPQKFNMDAAGQWMSADCGEIKPRDSP